MGNASSLVTEKSPQFLKKHQKIIKVSSKKFEAGDSPNKITARKNNKSQKYNARLEANQEKTEDLRLEDFEELDGSIDEKVKPFKLKNWADNVQKGKTEISPRKLNAIKGSRQERHAILADLKKAKIIEGQIVEAPGGKCWTVTMETVPIRHTRPRLESHKKTTDRREMLEIQRQNQIRAEQKRKDEMKKKMDAVREKTYKAHQMQETRRAQEKELRDKLISELDNRQMAVEKNKQKLTEERKFKILKDYRKKQQLLQKRLELELKGLLDENENSKSDVNEVVSDNEFEYSLKKERKEIVADKKDPFHNHDAGTTKLKNNAYLGTGSVNQLDAKSETNLDLNDDFWETTERPTYAAAHGPVNVNSPRRQFKETTKRVHKCDPEYESQVQPGCSKEKSPRNKNMDEDYANNHLNGYYGNERRYCEAGPNYVSKNSGNDFTYNGSYNIQIEEKPEKLNLAYEETDSRKVVLMGNSNKEDKTQMINSTKDDEEKSMPRGSEMYQYFWKKMNACENDLQKSSPKVAKSTNNKQNQWTEPLAPRYDKYYKPGNVEPSIPLRRPSGYECTRNKETQNFNSDISGRPVVSNRMYEDNRYDKGKKSIATNTDISPKNLNRGSYSLNSFSPFHYSRDVPLKGVQSDKMVDLKLSSPSATNSGNSKSSKISQREPERSKACDRNDEIPPRTTAESYKLEFLRELELN